MLWRNQTLIDGHGGLDRHELIHQRFVDATSKPTQHFGKDKVILATIYLDFLNSAGIHHPEVGAQSMTYLFI